MKCLRSVRASYLCLSLFALGLLAMTPALHAGNNLLGKGQLIGASKVEQTSGVWVDRQYVGYLRDSRATRSCCFCPASTTSSCVRSGYMDFAQRISVRPGEKQVIQVKMQKDPRLQLPRVTAEIKLDVTPSRAAVFVDDLFVGMWASSMAWVVACSWRRGNVAW